MWKQINRIFLLAALFAVVLVPAAMAAAPLKVGSRGNDVRMVQQILRARGYKVNVNGVYTPQTAKAVSEYQKDKKIQVSGNVGGWTYYLLTGDRSKLPPKQVQQKGDNFRINRQAVSKYPHFAGSDAAFGRQVVSSAYQYLGVPYVFGGNTPDGFDCSGFTKYVFSHNGINLPRLADEQYNVGERVRRSELMPGDLVFFTTYEPGVSHTGIYVGNNKFISATSSSGIRVDSLSDGYWAPRYVGATRVHR